MASASRIFRDEGVSRLPKLLWLISATLGSSPKPRTSAAARIAVSAIRAALGSKLTLVSAMNSAPPSSTRAWTAEASLICGRSPITSTMWRRWSEKRPTGPASIASASPRASITAAIAVRRVRSASRAVWGETPLRPTRSR